MGEHCRKKQFKTRDVIIRQGKIKLRNSITCMYRALLISDNKLPCINLMPGPSVQVMTMKNQYYIILLVVFT